MQLQKQDIVSTARQLSPKRSRLPGHRHTDQHNEGRHLYRNNRERVQTRYNQHTSSFRLSHKSSATSLSEHIWKLKENNTDHTVTWKILEKAQPYSSTTGKCDLCTTEKAYIAYTHPSLNKRRELFSTCPHRRKHLLSNLKSEEKKRSKRQCTKTSRRGRTKMSARNRPVEAKNVRRSIY